MDDTYDQDWAKKDPATAWHLIFRHADNWQETGDMMERWARAWVAANPVCDPHQTEGKQDPQ